MKRVCGVTFRGGDQYFYGRQTSHGFDRLARDHVSTSTLRCDLRLGRSFSPALEPPGGNSRCRAWMQGSTLVAKSYQVNVHFSKDRHTVACSTSGPETLFLAGTQTPGNAKGRPRCWDSGGTDGWTFRCVSRTPLVRQCSCGPWMSKVCVFLRTWPDEGKGTDELEEAF